ncbi:hypothetical protein SBA1_1200002 [Candidatus Sulfotelmatobacter kueseliae]|uniref:Uncharacterized protein n=1 Tax=Candidatus Sulfotelmatobacter kueseliae TaxID=2042962 RepID=A0A2U3K3D3_9BACT|nr:hypothetical protein SBA1_1200002 [Candidatus Sulfotelmatobacter kueseliae]
MRLKPQGLSKQAGRKWERLIKEVEASGLQLTPAHRAAQLRRLWNGGFVRRRSVGYS